MKNIIKDSEKGMENVVERLVEEYGAVRAGRATPVVLDRVNVDYYGTATPINQLATVSVPDARTLMIQPWDKSILAKVEKAIYVADIGLTPQNDGEVIRLNFPQLTEDSRKEIAKDISKMAEESKVGIRGVRREAMDELKALKKEYSEDEIRTEEDNVQELTDRFVKRLDGLFEEKEKEIMSV